MAVANLKRKPTFSWSESTSVFLSKLNNYIINQHKYTSGTSLHQHAPTTGGLKMEFRGTRFKSGRRFENTSTNVQTSCYRVTKTIVPDAQWNISQARVNLTQYRKQGNYTNNAAPSKSCEKSNTTIFWSCDVLQSAHDHQQDVMRQQ